MNVNAQIHAFPKPIPLFKQVETRFDPNMVSCGDS